MRMRKWPRRTAAGRNAPLPAAAARVAAALMVVASVSGACKTKPQEPPNASAPSPSAATSGSALTSDDLVRTLRERASKVNGFVAELTVRAGGASQSGTLLFLAPDRVHMEMKIAGLGEQEVVSDGRTLWTITPQARLATKVDLDAVQKSWHRPLPNQATAIRDVFEVVKPDTVRFVRNEQVQGTETRLFEGVPETGVNAPRDARLPDRIQAWIGEDGLLRRQVLMKGSEVLMDATFSIKDTNPHIRPGLFRFDPPSDYEVQDLTESTLKSLGSLERG